MGGDFTLFLRQLVSLSPVRYAHVVFFGAMFGGAGVALQEWIAPTHTAPMWSLVSAGVAFLTIPTWLLDAVRRTKRIRENLELLEAVVLEGKLTSDEQRQLYRKVAQGLVVAIMDETVRDAERRETDTASDAEPRRLP